VLVRKLCQLALAPLGMRAIKTVITRAGILKRAEPQLEEDKLLLRALRDVNVPKFLKADLPLFESIISDLFPRVERPTPDYGVLMDALVAACKDQGSLFAHRWFTMLSSDKWPGLQPVAPFLDKCVQLYETTIVRHGLMLVGPTGGGKTSTLITLQKALSSLKGNPPVRRHVALRMPWICAYGFPHHQIHNQPQGCDFATTVRRRRSAHAGMDGRHSRQPRARVPVRAGYAFCFVVLDIW